MVNGLLISSETVKLLIQYGVYVAIIIVGTIAIGVCKSRAKRQLKPQSVKAACVKAKKFAEKAQGLDEAKLLLLGTSRLLKVKNKVEDAAWAAFQVVEAKKDIIFEGISGTLEGAANNLMKEVDSGFIAKTEYDNVLKGTISTLDEVIAKLDKMLEK